ncbi:MAG TPA: (d)CMP kinase [Aestuariivirgaceae bacterium]|jgi:CMP/dCMP kinase|nr:(d)CMP kinase [Aestuariivirgaceae bacterium]
MIIAVDGPAASGKGTLARRLAGHFDLHHLDTGLIYRAVGLAVRASGHDLDDVAAGVRAAGALDLTQFSPEALRSTAAGEAASRVAAIPEVRAALLEYQRNFARREPGAVLDGRDIGTVVCPDADVKLFVTATAETRARRRWHELAALGDPLSYEAVLADIQRRDARDSERAVAPLKPDAGARLLDTTLLDIEAAFQAALDLVESSFNQGLRRG